MTGAARDDLPPLPPELQDELMAALFGDPRERPAWLERLRAGAGEHADALVAHLDWFEQLQRPAAAVDAVEVEGYRIVEKLAEGGMGTVYLAEQAAPLRRQVALKLVKADMASGEVVARFEREREALARMEHDAIARVYDCGTTAAGQPYFAMEYVPGQPIDRFCDRRDLPLRQRLELLQQVCHGVQHAHQKGVIHRDLKPSNVLVVEHDGAFRVKIIDFGVARAVLSEHPDDRLFTRVGQFVGTPEYAAPEQAVGDVGRVDTRSDVYSLGVLLYELVAGALPFAQAAGGPVTPWDLVRRLREEDPPKPSSRIGAMGDGATAVAARRRTTVGSLQRQLRGDLDWIVLKALAREPDRRYASASELAEELQRYLDGRPVEAGPPSRWYRLSKALRRHAVASTVGAAFVVTLAIGLGTTQYALARVRQSQQRVDLLTNVVQLQNGRRDAMALVPITSARVGDLERWLATYAAPLDAALAAVTDAIAALEAGDGDGDLSPGTREFLLAEYRRYREGAEAFAAAEVEQVRAQLRWARRLDELTQNHPNARHTWAEAAAAIRASPRYAGSAIDLVPQEGLVPIGPNPQSGLWEFYDLRSAVDIHSGEDPGALPIPVPDDEGRVAVGEDTGIVFVLLPGGRAVLGVQSSDPDGPNHDPSCAPHRRVYEVELEPFFLAKHELTQGQWLRLAGEPWTCWREIGYRCHRMDEPVSLRHPVELVAYSDCAALLPRLGLELPSESQWEYACRGGSPTPWSFGAALTDLRGKVNLLDTRAQAVNPEWTGQALPWDDGHVIHAPVGSYEANAFGLHDMHGNVFEWCREDAEAAAAATAGDETPAAGRKVVDQRCLRGGSFVSHPKPSKAWFRAMLPVDDPRHFAGCRAARALQLR